MNDTAEPIGKIYTLAEAAERLRLTPRRVAKLARQEGACSLSGRNVLISEADISVIWQAMRPASPTVAEPQSRSASEGLLALAPSRKQSR
jgi:hypothetical protein